MRRLLCVKVAADGPDAGVSHFGARGARAPGAGRTMIHRPHKKQEPTDSAARTARKKGGALQGGGSSRLFDDRLLRASSSEHQPITRSIGLVALGSLSLVLAFRRRLVAGR